MFLRGRPISARIEPNPAGRIKEVFSMVGILVNILAVALGGLCGALFGRRLNRDFAAKLNDVFGVCSIGMGIASVARMENMPAVILAVVAGTALGLALHLGRHITAGGMLLQKPLAKVFPAPSDGEGQEEFFSLLVTVLVLFCTSGTVIYGCLEAGMTGSASVLMSKSILDFFAAAVFACSLGAVTALIAVPQAAIFLVLFFCARAIYPLTTPTMIADFRACGGFLMIATGLRVAKIREFPVADMIPAMVLVMPLSRLWTDCIVPLL